MEDVKALFCGWGNVCMKLVTNRQNSFGFLVWAIRGKYRFCGDSFRQYNFSKNILQLWQDIFARPVGPV